MLPDPILFGVVRMYGVMVAVGILAAYAVLFIYSKKLNIEPKFSDFIFYNSIVAIGIGFLSAALFQATYNYIENPEAGFDFGSGITFIGGVIGGAAFFVLFYIILRKRYKTNLMDTLSMFPCCILIGHAFGRIGCFFAGCCYGKATDSFLGVQFPHLIEKVHPTMLYEAAFLFIMFAVCSVLLLKYKSCHNMSLYMFSYGVFRFLVEFLRGDDRGAFLGIMSPSQFWSAIMIIGAVVLFFFERKRKKQLEGLCESSEAKESIPNDENSSEA